jgi:hypothetical protein
MYDPVWEDNLLIIGGNDKDIYAQVEQSRDPKNKTMHLKPADSQQRYEKHTFENTYIVLGKLYTYMQKIETWFLTLALCENKLKMYQLPKYKN